MEYGRTLKRMPTPIYIQRDIGGHGFYLNVFLSDFYDLISYLCSQQAFIGAFIRSYHCVRFDIEC